MQDTLGGGGGTIQVGTAQNASPTLIFDFPNAPGTGWTLARPLINYGTIEWKGDADITVDNGGRIDNNAGATFDIQVDQTMAAGAGAGAFTNNGTFQKSDGGGTATIGIQFNANGNEDIDSGKVDWKKKVKKMAGTMTAEPGTGIVLESGIEQDAGTVTVTSATVTINNGGYPFTVLHWLRWRPPCHLVRSS
jgi:hypothetical protein